MNRSGGRRSLAERRVGGAGGRTISAGRSVLGSGLSSNKPGKRGSQGRSQKIHKGVSATTAHAQN